jgi:hypothetical protein
MYGYILIHTLSAVSVKQTAGLPGDSGEQSYFVYLKAFPLFLFFNIEVCQFIRAAVDRFG